MSEKSKGSGNQQGFLDSIFENPFGGMFDVNGDGMEDFGEQWLGLKTMQAIFEDEEKDADSDNDDVDPFDTFADEPDYSWRLYCEDGEDWGIDPEDYETEEEYEEALENAKLEAEEAFTDNSANDYFVPAASSGALPNAETPINQNLQTVATTKEAPFRIRGAVETDGTNQSAVTGMSREEYEESRRETILTVIQRIIITLFLSAIPCLMITAAFSSADGFDSNGLVCLVFGGLGIALLVMILEPSLSAIFGDLNKQQIIKETYLSSISEDEKQERARKSRTRKIVFLILVLLMISAFAAERFYVFSIYSDAETMIFEERFEEARSMLEKIKDQNYKDKAALLLLCDAHEAYSDGYYASAYYIMEEAHFYYQSDEHMNSIQTFRQILEQEHDQYIEELAASEAQKREDKIRRGVPYEGMSELRIADTSLGKPSDKVRHNSEIKNGKVYTANIYDFYSEDKLIFTARCVDGYVTNVWDDRYD